MSGRYLSLNLNLKHPEKDYTHIMNASNDNQKKTKPLEAQAGAPDKPLLIGNIEIPCYVLADETRVISQRGLYSSLGTTSGGNYGTAVDRGAMPRFAQAKWLNPHISEELTKVLSSPIEFTPPHGGRTAYGYPATGFVELCEAILKARDAGSIEFEHSIVRRADIILRGLAVVGIIALIDEATGYQDIRVKRALAEILEKYLAKELQPWIKTYPLEFYEQICRLKNWPKEHALNRPSVIGKYTNDIVYDRLGPGLRDELCKLNPKSSNGQRLNKHHQWLTPEHGHMELRMHLSGVIALMKISHNWDAFKRKVASVYPKPNEQLPLTFGDE